ncbi:hypothetical protein C4N15_07485 [Fusobacterium necrophorum subsp. funduliforme]|uniref:hypothetical protein n=1 Tax=Fusobacterium necrophorum TaxID=859 RepID=UPI000D127525|nr:hypothetical protein [Fusobacterium necrophorum]AVQ21499.1 hypothetical protein C4N15_07485 [Fusobacterium necrophorum subsp. funduliforme]
MEFVFTKNSLVELDVFFYKPGFTNIQRPTISLLKIDSSRQTTPLYHIGFKDNMGYLSSNQIVSGVMVFEVLEGYPLQSLLFINNDKEGTPFQQSLEELEAMDFYVIQKRNQDPYGDFVLKNVKFIDTKMTQSTEEFSRRIMATYVAESKIPFRIPFFFNHFKSDNYSSHIVRNVEEIEQIKKDVNVTWKVLPRAKKEECYIKLSGKGANIVKREYAEISLEIILDTIEKTWKEHVSNILLRTAMKPHSAIYRLRNFIFAYYKYANAYNYLHAKARGDLEFLQFINLGSEGILSKLGIDSSLVDEIAKTEPKEEVEAIPNKDDDITPFKMEIDENIETKSEKDDDDVAKKELEKTAKEPKNTGILTKEKEKQELIEFAKEQAKELAGVTAINHNEPNFIQRAKLYIQKKLSEANPDLLRKKDLLEKLAGKLYNELKDNSKGNHKIKEAEHKKKIKDKLNRLSLDPNGEEVKDAMLAFKEAYNEHVLQNLDRELTNNKNIQKILETNNVSVMKKNIILDTTLENKKKIEDVKNMLKPYISTFYNQVQNFSLSGRKTFLNELYQDFKNSYGSSISFDVFTKMVTNDKNYRDIINVRKTDGTTKKSDTKTIYEILYLYQESFKNSSFGMNKDEKIDLLRKMYKEFSNNRKGNIDFNIFVIKVAGDEFYKTIDTTIKSDVQEKEYIKKLDNNLLEKTKDILQQAVENYKKMKTGDYKQDRKLIQKEYENYCKWINTPVSFSDFAKKLIGTSDFLIMFRNIDIRDTVEKHLVLKQLQDSYNNGRMILSGYEKYNYKLENHLYDEYSRQVKHPMGREAFINELRKTRIHKNEHKVKNNVSEQKLLQKYAKMFAKAKTGTYKDDAILIDYYRTYEKETYKPLSIERFVQAIYGTKEVKEFVETYSSTEVNVLYQNHHTLRNIMKKYKEKYNVVQNQKDVHKDNSIFFKTLFHNLYNDFVKETDDKFGLSFMDFVTQISSEETYNKYFAGE